VDPAQLVIVGAGHAGAYEASWAGPRPLWTTMPARVAT
jgi:NADH dehydrogenase FAD-containing subunit